MSRRKNNIITRNYKFRRCSLGDTSANQMTQSSGNAIDSEGTFVSHLVHIAYPTTLLGILYTYQEWYSL